MGRLEAPAVPATLTTVYSYLSVFPTPRAVHCLQMDYKAAARSLAAIDSRSDSDGHPVRRARTRVRMARTRFARRY